MVIQPTRMCLECLWMLVSPATRRQRLYIRYTRLQGQQFTKCVLPSHRLAWKCLRPITITPLPIIPPHPPTKTVVSVDISNAVSLVPIPLPRTPEPEPEPESGRPQRPPHNRNLSSISSLGFPLPSLMRLLSQNRKRTTESEGKLKRTGDTKAVHPR